MNRVFWQIILLSIITLVFAFIGGWFSARSVLLGGGAWLIPSLYFIWRRNRTLAMFNIRKMLKSFLLSEIVKLLLSFSIVILILLTLSIDPKGFLFGYIAMILVSILDFFTAK